MLGGAALGTMFLGGIADVAATTMDFRLYVNGVDLSGALGNQTLTISDELSARSTCEFTLQDIDDEITLEVGQRVIVLDDGVRIFAGTIETITDHYPSKRLTETAHVIEVSCVDLNQVCDRHQVAEVYETPGQTAGEIVRDIISSYLAADGIVVGIVDDGVEMGKIVYPYNMVTECLDEISQMVGFIWNVDYWGRLNFCDRTRFDAPWSLADGSNLYLSCMRERTRANYRNVQRVRAGRDVTATARTEYFYGERTGSVTEDARQTYTVALPIAREPTVTVDSGAGPVAQTVGIKEVDDARQWYYEVGSDTITQEDDDAPLTTTDQLAVTYHGYFDVIVEESMPAEIARRQDVEGGSGRYEAIEDDEKLDNEKLELSGAGYESVSQLAVQRAEGLLREYARIPIIATVTTDQPGLRAGHFQEINLTREQLAGRYLIVGLEIQDMGQQQFRYTYRLVDGEQVASPYKYWLRLAKAGRKFVIRDNELLVIVQEHGDTIGISDEQRGTEGDQLPYYMDDPCSVFRVGEAIVGRIYWEFGQVVGRAGAHVGTLAHVSGYRWWFPTVPDPVQPPPSLVHVHDPAMTPTTFFSMDSIPW